MVTKLTKHASGQRHLRWGREVLASIHAHIKLNHELTEPQIHVLNAEKATWSALVSELEAAVVPYRQYLDTAYIDNRAEQRVGDYLCDTAIQHADGAFRHLKEDVAAHLPGGFSSILSNLALSRILSAGRAKTVELTRNAALLIESLPGSFVAAQSIAAKLNKAADSLAAANEHRAEVIDPQRKPLRLRVERAVMDLREGSEQMDGRLRSHFPGRFIDSLYPELNRNQSQVPDDETDETDLSDMD
ncbi:MAG: hypothetical protein HUU55_09240 [Myxococcales bacterium]|nr:hypothetical protein [Myxococcales bacterium]